MIKKGVFIRENTGGFIIFDFTFLISLFNSSRDQAYTINVLVIKVVAYFLISP